MRMCDEREKVPSRRGIVAVEALAGLSPEPLRDDRIPSVPYTDPEMASVGLAEALLALALEATLDELATVVHAHPTPSEALGEAALAAQGRALRL